MKPFDFESVKPLYAIAKDRISKVYFTLVKLPLMLFAIVAGFVFEFILELPFILLILVGYRSKNKKQYLPYRDGEQLILHKK